MRVYLALQLGALRGNSLLAKEDNTRLDAMFLNSILRVLVAALERWAISRSHSMRGETKVFRRDLGGPVFKKAPLRFLCNP